VVTAELIEDGAGLGPRRIEVQRSIPHIRKEGDEALARVARIASRLLALAAAISLNHQLGRPSRALVDYVA
jgi:hypothetical protein